MLLGKVVVQYNAGAVGARDPGGDRVRGLHREMGTRGRRRRAGTRRRGGWPELGKLVFACPLFFLMWSSITFQRYHGMMTDMLGGTASGKLPAMALVSAALYPVQFGLGRQFRRGQKR